jgi:peroxiredoxin/tetratricopeptide (TPR) repeat protein
MRLDLHIATFAQTILFFAASSFGAKFIVGHIGAIMSVPRLVVCVLSLLAWVNTSAADDKPGHSRHGSAFDTGLRQKPWRMEGIGKAHFPITTTVPEVQEWFDQGNALLHSFWYEEAERSFRWCLKLDPDCAMAYWGLARCGINWSTGLFDHPDVKRYKDFLKEAVRRKDSATPRERMYIEAWDETMRAEPPERSKLLLKKLHEIVLRFPDDLEAASLLALSSIESGNALGTEMIIRDVLVRDPNHPGAHHARIHNWDGVFAEQAISSCEAYGRIAPGIGHAMHMPGHNYSKIGMWHEAAYSMDAATRFELRYMNERLALPFETWNFAHNRNYLCYIQEQLGMADASLQGSRDLMAAPREPKRGKEPEYNIFDQGMAAQIRALVKFERWDDIMTPGTIPWRDTEDDKLARALVETLAYIGMGKTVDARGRFAELKELARPIAEQTKDMPGNPLDIELSLAEGLLCAAEGKLLDATRFLTAAAAIEQSQRDAGLYPNDPPYSAWPVNRILGDVYLRAGESGLAIRAYERSLEQEPNDAFSLAGLAQAYSKSGNREKATEYSGRFGYVWSSCDSGLRWKREVEALGLNAAPIAQTPAPERRYTTEALADIGPLNWQPFAAPRLECTDADGKAVVLENFRGKNVILVFYLGDQCVHCVEQLVAICGRSADWERENTVVLAVSSTSPERNKESDALGTLPMRLLSDQDHKNARRFTSYDDFEEMELHSTILIDTKGRVHWKRTGGDPFTDMDFLLESLKRMNAKPEAARSAK